MIALLLLALSLTASDSTQHWLPEGAQRVLDSRLTVNWKLSDRYLYKCNLNGDSVPDYALEATVGKDSCMIRYFVALIAYDYTYAFHLLLAYPASLDVDGRDEGFELRHKGEAVPNYNDYDEEKDDARLMTLPTDAIELIPDGCCVTIHIFRNGTFEFFTSSD